MPASTFHIHERFLRHIWGHQLLRVSGLTTVDGRPVRIIDPGRLHFDGGPDFRDATVSIGGTTYRGDVELHRAAEDWVRHRHHRNPQYNAVILHVVFSANGETGATFVQSGRRVPVLLLSPHLTESLRSVWQSAIQIERAYARERIPCADTNDNLTPELLRAWLHKLAVERLELKIRRFDERLRELALERIRGVRENPRTWGPPPSEDNPEEIPVTSCEFRQRDFAARALWDQLLYEGLMESLGYSKNRTQFLRIAKEVSVGLAKMHHWDVLPDGLESVFFGVAGLLPRIGAVRGRETLAYVRRLHNRWKEVRHIVGSGKLHAGDWQFFPLRPANVPTVRLAVGAALLRSILHDDLFRSLIQCLKEDSAAAVRTGFLERLFRVHPDAYWLHRSGFAERQHERRDQLGDSRIHAIIVNVVVPLAGLYARIFKDHRLHASGHGLWFTLPPHEDNSILQRMDRELLKGRLRPASAGEQQALLQLALGYCRHGRCGECELGGKPSI